MISFLPLVAYLLQWLCSIHGTNGENWPVLNASLVPLDKRDYNIRDNYCRLLAHTSLLLRDPRNGHLMIVVDGGMAKYKVQVERSWIDEFNKSKVETDWEVPDLNGDTAIINLDVDFTLNDVNNRIKIIPKPKVNKNYVPVVNRGYMWTDSNGNIYISGGHFFEQAYWDESLYHTQKGDIPNFSIWRYSIYQEKWDEVFLDSSGNPMIRLISSAATSVPGSNLSFAFAGYLSPRSGRDNANGNWATSGMVHYNHSTNMAYNISQPGQLGYTHGSLHHIGPFGDHTGLLLVLMAKEHPLNLNFIENEPTHGKSFDFTKIRFYNPDTNKWYIQQADFISDEKPTTRTRFCSVLVREEGTKTWDLWLYGGQGTEDVETNPSDIWVLTMPAFMWLKVSHSFESIYTRGHTCHAVGNQMIVLGGYPASKVVDPKAPCDSSFIKIFDMTQKSWTGEFKVNSTYKQPTGINGLDRWRNSPPRHGWGSEDIESFLGPTPDPPPPPPGEPKGGLSLGGSIGVSVGGLIGLILTGAFIYWRFWIYVPINQGEQGHIGSVLPGSVMTDPMGKHELSGISNRTPIQIAAPIIPKPDWEAPDEPGSLNTSPPPTLSSPISPAQAQS